ncbi:MAG: hypothetical protein AB1Z98_21670 [Nannocystaceae bacterium]
MEFSDEFDDASRLSQWNRAHEQEGYAALHSVLDVDQSTPGELTLVPLPGVGWFGDFQGPLLYKNVAGDFVVETFVTAGNAGDPLQPPTQLFNSAGLLVRDPDHGPGTEDWLMHNAGYQATFVGTEGKTTVGSSSVLTLVPGSHRLRLRVCRFGSRIVLARQDEPGAAFVATHDYDRPDLPDELQVGLIVNGWGANEDQPNPASTPDLRASFDYIRLWHTSSEADCLGD